jgi:AraC-like DNA-binding protein
LSTTQPVEQSPAPPLSHFEVLRTDDFERARHVIGQAFQEHTALLRGSREDLDVRVHHCALPRIQLNYVSYGAETRLMIPPSGGFQTVHFPLRDGHRITYGNETAELPASRASVASASRHVELEFGSRFSLMSLTVDDSVLERQLEALTGVGVHRPIEFAISTDITRGPGASLFRLTRFISDELDRSSSLARERLVIAKLEDTALTALLTGLTHNYSARFRQRIAETTPRQVRVVEEYIEANADEPISIGELADLAGVSAKSLFAAFRRHRGYSPMAYVKSCRLLRAREELTTAAPGANVTRVALDSGFTCLGRFSVAYKQKFGESPSETLRRHR